MNMPELSTPTPAIHPADLQNIGSLTSTAPLPGTRPPRHSITEAQQTNHWLSVANAAGKQPDYLRA